MFHLRGNTVSFFLFSFLLSGLLRSNQVGSNFVDTKGRVGRRKIGLLLFNSQICKGDVVGASPDYNRLGGSDERHRALSAELSAQDNHVSISFSAAIKRRVCCWCVSFSKANCFTERSSYIDHLRKSFIHRTSTQPFLSWKSFLTA